MHFFHVCGNLCGIPHFMVSGEFHTNVWNSIQMCGKTYRIPIEMCEIAEIPRCHGRLSRAWDGSEAGSEPPKSYSNRHNTCKPFGNIHLGGILALRPPPSYPSLGVPCTNIQHQYYLHRCTNRFMRGHSCALSTAALLCKTSSS